MYREVFLWLLADSDDDPLQMITLMLDDLCQKTGVLLLLPVPILIRVLYFYILISRGLSCANERETALLCLIR